FAWPQHEGPVGAVCADTDRLSRDQGLFGRVGVDRHVLTLRASAPWSRDRLDGKIAWERERLARTGAPAPGTTGTSAGAATYDDDAVCWTHQRGRAGYPLGVPTAVGRGSRSQGREGWIGEQLAGGVM